MPTTTAQDLDLGTPIPCDNAVLEDKLVGLLGAYRSGQLEFLSVVAVHRGGVVDTLTSGRSSASSRRGEETGAPS